MAKVALKALDYPPSPDGYQYFDEIRFGSGSAGPKPQPPGGGGEQPPRPWEPLFPTNPIQLPPWAGGEQPGGGGGGGIPGTPVTIVPMPPQEPPVEVPAGLPEGSVQVLVIIPGERYPAVGWMQPYPSSGPVPEAPA